METAGRVALKVRGKNDWQDGQEAVKTYKFNSNEAQKLARWVHLLRRSFDLYNQYVTQIFIQTVTEHVFISFVTSAQAKQYSVIVQTFPCKRFQLVF